MPLVFLYKFCYSFSSNLNKRFLINRSDRFSKGFFKSCLRLCIGVSYFPFKNCGSSWWVILGLAPLRVNGSQVGILHVDTEKYQYILLLASFIKKHVLLKKYIFIKDKEQSHVKRFCWIYQRRFDILFWGISTRLTNTKGTEASPPKSRSFGRVSLVQLVRFLVMKLIHPDLNTKFDMCYIYG
jgi:hypothetical protein